MKIKYELYTSNTTATAQDSYAAGNNIQTQKSALQFFYVVIFVVNALSAMVI